MRLSKSERNAVFLAIQNAGLKPADFTLSSPEQGPTIISHHETPSVLMMAPSGTLVGRVGDELPRSFSGEQKWPQALDQWLLDVRNDLETPDLWEELRRQEGLLEATPGPDDSDTPFTTEEQEEIERRLREIAVYASDSENFSEGELQLLNAKLDYLIASSKYSRRSDWKNQVAGALLGAVVGNALPSGATIDVLNMLLRSIGHLLGSHGLELPR